MKLKAGVLAIAAFWSGVVFATTNTQDLKLNCDYEVKVLDSTNYYVDNSGTRANSYYGVLESLELLAITGADCQKLTDHYGVTFQVGEVIELGRAGFAASRVRYLDKNLDQIGTSKIVAPTQSFGYQLKNGQLPWFPTIHAESVQVLGKTGVADVKALYGTKELSSLDESFKLKSAEKIIRSMGYGKDLAKTYIGHDNQVKLKLLLQLLPQTKSSKLEYLQDILLVFDNAVQFQSTFTTGDHRVELGRVINQLLNELGQTKFGRSKLEVLQKQPALFAEQIVAWLFSQTEKAPQLNSDELELFLEFALEKVEILQQIPEVHEARVLKAQYVNAAKTIKKYASPSSLKTPYYQLNIESEDILTKILKI